MLKKMLILFYVILLIGWAFGSFEEFDIRALRAQCYIGLGLLGTIYFIYFQDQKNKQLQERLKTMHIATNPHFVANSLNAIEGLINLGKSKAAAKYLVHFSRLSRNLLNNAKKMTVSLAQEVKTLEHFLVLAQLRFRDTLSYDIQVSPTINRHTVAVPTMLLQPYVERAIWCGLKPKTGGGHLHIKISKIDSLLCYSIEDNGVGRAQSSTMRAASVLKNQSLETQITEESLRRMAQSKGAQVIVRDVINNAGQTCGTKVFIHFPYRIVE